MSINIERELLSKTHDNVIFLSPEIFQENTATSKSTQQIFMRRERLGRIIPC